MARGGRLDDRGAPVPSLSGCDRRRGRRPSERTMWREIGRASSGTVLIGAALAANAQEEAPLAQLGRVEVTGSHIRRIEGETGLPLQVMTRADLERDGVQTAQELLDRISANQSFGGWNEAKGEGNTLVGFNAASLRGLGYQRTLVLLDGRRVAPYALSGGQSVDLSSIPASAIERVEILKDGASAVYGTDAIGGVINFVLRKDFTGLEVNAIAFITEHPGGNNRRISATAGYGDLAKDRYNAFLSVDYFRQDPLKASQRDSTRTSYVPDIGLDKTSQNTFPANIRGFGQARDSFRNPTIPYPAGANAQSCAPPFSFPVAAAPYACWFDYASVIETIPQSERWNAIGRYSWQVNADTQFFAEGSYYRGTFIQRISPTPVVSSLGNAYVLAPTSPYYPAAYVASLPNGDPTQPVRLNWRLVDFGPRVDEVTNDQWRAVIGLQGSARGWDYEVSANYTGNRQIDRYVSGFFSDTALVELVASGVVNPFGPNSAAVHDAILATKVTGQANDNRASDYGAELKVTRSVYALPGGDVNIALGLQGRREMLAQSNADFFASGDVLGAGAQVPSLPKGNRTVWSAFGEVNVPVSRTFEANVAVRYDDYTDFGGTTNPKVTLRWQPVRQLLFRASYGTGFRAPTLSDLFQPQIIAPEAVGFYDDPVRCPITGSETDCAALFGAKSGGNPALQPEKSKQVNAGLVIEPVAGVSASIDYYRVRIDNLIQMLTDAAIFADFGRWSPAYVVRKPAEPEQPNLPGPIDYVVTLPINAGTLATSGYDIDLRWRPSATAIGQFALSLTGTYVRDYGISDLNTELFPTHAGTRGPDGAIARWRHYATLDWSNGPWGATLSQTFQSGYSEVDLRTCDQNFDNCTGTRHVAAYSVWNVQGRYTGFTNATIGVGVRNLLDRAPPVTNQLQDFQVGIDPSYADPRGRAFYATIRYAFK
jgi:iron complex outermembrane recepter protein